MKMVDNRFALAAVLLCVAGTVSALLNREGDVLSSAKQAKSFLRVKRSWGIRLPSIRLPSIRLVPPIIRTPPFRTPRVNLDIGGFIRGAVIGLLGKRERERESGERRREANHRNWLNTHCRANCWGSWRSWDACSAPCGSNRYQTSRRSRAEPSSCTSWVNSNGCPGSSYRTRACAHNCKNGGAPRDGGCSCMAGWRGTCCDQRITCSFPGKPSHGQVSLSSSSHVYGSTARFSCDVGYRLVGPQSRTCLGSGRWSNTVPVCNIIRCPEPGTPANGSRSGADFTYGMKVVYTCDTGFRLAGPARRTCQADGNWDGTPASCDRTPCPKLNIQEGGDISVPSSPAYGDTATYTCSLGRHLVGSSVRNCLASGQWSGSQPSCKVITCPALQPIPHGHVTPEGAVEHGRHVNYTCQAGYTLVGNGKRTCGGEGPQGVWSGQQPECKPVDCGDPGVPDSGMKMGSSYHYPSVVSYLCLPGYYMQGADRITCTQNASWSADIPRCTACPRNMYKSGSNAQTECAACPSSSGTATVASTDVTQCQCHVGFQGPLGGPCSEIRCPALPLPASGVILACNTTYNRTCSFDCTDGFILSSGDAMRTCRLDATWSGGQPVCTVCPKNTYKSDGRNCVACPPNSQTDGVGNMRTGCVCKAGFSGPPGGPCQDIDECAVSQGGCEQQCHNTVGSYKCVCNIPGFSSNPRDPKSCLETIRCSDFQEPTHGGAVCSLTYLTNTRRCQIKCNQGYDFIDRPNLFEECGPNTNWQWSYEIKQEEVPPCVEEFFPGVQNELELFYFVSNCSLLTAEQKGNLRNAFVTMLKQQGICSQEDSDMQCNIDDVRISCGKEEDFDFSFDFRRKRSLSRHVLQFKFKIKVPNVSAKNVNCDRYCPGMNVTDVNCKEMCRSAHKNESTVSVNKASADLQNIFKANVREVRQQSVSQVFLNHTTTTSQMRVMSAHGTAITNVTTRPTANLMLKLGSESLVPATSAVRISTTGVQCEKGTVMRNSDKCVACPAGTYARYTSCVTCPLNMHQPRTRQTRCWPCPPGSVTRRRGSRACTIVGGDRG